jgi:hypothetical protein
MYHGTNIRFGPSAFSSPGWLASSIAHENVHLQQLLDGHMYYDDPGTALNELEAYNWELGHASEMGLTTSEVEKIEGEIEEYGNIWNSLMPGVKMPSNYIYLLSPVPTPTYAY